MWKSPAHRYRRIARRKRSRVSIRPHSGDIGLNTLPTTATVLVAGDGDGDGDGNGRLTGSYATYDVLYQTTDAELLARATVWAGVNPSACNQIFSITNGGQFRWSQLWPRCAEHFSMDYATPQQRSLADAMPTRGDVGTLLVGEIRPS